MVIIDYLQLLRGDDRIKHRGDSRQQEVANISRLLKAYARELNTPVMALAQLSRKIEERKIGTRPLLSDLRESGAIEQDADLVTFIYREDYYSPNQREQESGSPAAVAVEIDGRKVEYIIAKHRNGPTAEIPLIFDKITGRLPFALTGIGLLALPMVLAACTQSAQALLPARLSYKIPSIKPDGSTSTIDRFFYLTGSNTTVAYGKQDPIADSETPMTKNLDYLYFAAGRIINTIVRNFTNAICANYPDLPTLELSNEMSPEQDFCQLISNHDSVGKNSLMYGIAEITGFFFAAYRADANSTNAAIEGILPDSNRTLKLNENLKLNMIFNMIEETGDLNDKDKLIPGLVSAENNGISQIFLGQLPGDDPTSEEERKAFEIVNEKTTRDRNNNADVPRISKTLLLMLANLSMLKQVLASETLREGVTATTELKAPLTTGMAIGIFFALVAMIVSISLVKKVWYRYQYNKRYFVIPRVGVKGLSYIGMVIAVSVAIILIIATVTSGAANALFRALPGSRVAIESVLIKIGGLLFGPILGLFIGAAIDFLTIALSGGVFHYGYLISAMAFGILAGFIKTVIIYSRGKDFRFAVYSTLVIAACFGVVTALIYALNGLPDPIKFQFFKNNSAGPGAFYIDISLPKIYVVAALGALFAILAIVI
ncbi:unnamed protein product [Didymodactylos carnosus]|uniref:SF4 helicase domain-containing protein n=1 Tax=Didymodactylos carnosus TaxID=1234261 RepID=A0A8S2HHW6_9BILA|nr:unnamed protein product [Didymodactylos carnosus]CAF3646439.1 unnamed protein product [Didymodactylos carnosus]